MTKKFTRLSRSAEDYLEAIGHLCRENGRAQVSDVAAMLNVKKPSVTAAAQLLAEGGYITYRRYAPIELTEKGQQYADLVIRSHGILQRFLVEMGGLTPDRAETAACSMEHILSFEEIAAMGERIEQLCPGKEQLD